jgi:hypothetical protein
MVDSMFQMRFQKLFMNLWQHKEGVSNMNVSSGLLTHLLEMSSDKIILRCSVRLLVQRWFWYITSSADQGVIMEKYLFFCI